MVNRRRGALLVAIVSIAVLAGCSSLSTPRVTPGVYEGPHGASITLKRSGDGAFNEVSAKAAANGDPGLITGRVAWHLSANAQGGADLLFYPETSIRPPSYYKRAMSGEYVGGDKPYILFYIGDPDDNHTYKLSLENR